jgi:hypothetical protein
MAFAATGAEGDIHAGEPEHRFYDGFLLRLGFLRTDTELFTDTFEVLVLAAVGQEAEMTDLHEA